MSIEALQASVQEILNSPTCSVEFFFVLKSDGDLILKRPDMNHVAQTELGNQFIAALRTQVSEREGVSLVELTNADERTNVIYHYDLAPLPAQLETLNTLTNNEINDAFSFNTDSLKDLEAIVILVGDQAGQIAIYKHHYPVTLMQRNSGFSIVRAGATNRFEKLDRDILKISPKFEFFMVNGQCYVLELATLERFYGFKEAIKNVATEAIALVTASALIADVAVLTARMDDLSFCRKLARLTRSSPVLGVVSNQEIIEFVTGHPKLAGKFALNDENTQFLLKTKVSQNLFLKLLNDDYLKSLLTQTDYDSLAKDSLIAAELEPPAVA
jgi:hypothetical protein